MVETTKGLIAKLVAWFPKQKIMDGIMAIVCPQYYLQTNGETTFPRHLKMFKFFYYNLCLCGQAKREKLMPMVLAILSSWDLHAQQGLFKLNMIFNVSQTMVEVRTLDSNMVNPIVVNPITYM
jgi:hypothetical protein